MLKCFIFTFDRSKRNTISNRRSWLKTYKLQTYFLVIKIKIFFCICRCLENANPVTIKLNNLLKEGKIPSDYLYYKFIDNTTLFASVNPQLASNLTWDRDLCEFYDTIRYLGGTRTRNFIRGPGFVGTGRGGAKEFRTFSDFDLCGPLSNSSQRFHTG